MTSNNHLEFYVNVSSSSVQQLRIQDGAIVPITDNDIDLGTSLLEFKDLHLDGTANIDSLVADTADINAGTVDAVIGGTTPAAGTFTTLTANTSLALASGATVTSINDEDTMSSDSATALATQQSIKAYVDSQVTAQDLDFQADTGGALNIDLDSETLTLTGGTGIDTSGSGNTVTFAIDSTVTTLTGSQTLTNKTLTSPVLNTGVSGTAVLDEDNMASDSATQLATQQSIKAYVDTTVAATNEVVEDTTPQLGGDLASNGNDILFADNDKAIFGGGSDLQIYHTGTNSIIDDLGTGNLLIRSDGSAISLQVNSKNNIRALSDAEVELYHNNNLKFATTSSGIDVTGTAVTDGLTVAGNVSVDGGTIKLDGNYPVGTNNTALGNQALDDASLTGASNVAIGYQSLTVNTTGSNNNAIGELNH
jgi:hypothetical protein